MLGSLSGHACRVLVRYEANRYPVPAVDAGGGEYLLDMQVYAVIELGMDPARWDWFRIENRDGTPALYDSRCFSEVEGTIPADWQVRLADSGSVTFGPAPFLVLGFWEKYFDGDSEAIEIYRATLAHDRS